ncbi:MAG: hypothetical protein RLY93_20615 [Sumerlaeia bacterium]
MSLMTALNPNVEAMRSRMEREACEGRQRALTLELEGKLDSERSLLARRRLGVLCGRVFTASERELDRYGKEIGEICACIRDASGPEVPATIDEETEAFEEGFSSGSVGISADANEYPCGSLESHDWRQGWLAAQGSF